MAAVAFSTKLQLNAPQWAQSKSNMTTVYLDKFDRLLYDFRSQTTAEFLKFVALVRVNSDRKLLNSLLPVATNPKEIHKWKINVVPNWDKRGFQMQEVSGMRPRWKSSIITPGSATSSPSLVPAWTRNSAHSTNGPDYFGLALPPLWAILRGRGLEKISSK